MPGAIPSQRSTTVLGREDAADITLHDPLVSKRHVRFGVSSVVEVVDLGWATGVANAGGRCFRRCERFNSAGVFRRHQRWHRISRK